MAKKLKFYNDHGVDKYYVYNPDTNDLAGFQRRQGELIIIDAIENWVSPRLGIRFELTAETLFVYYPDGRRFLTTVELAELSRQEARRAEQAERELDPLRTLLAEAGIQA